MAINDEGCFPLIAWLCYTMYNVSIDNLLNNYFVNIINYILCITTTHFLYDQVTITQAASHLSSATYIYTILKLHATL